MKFMLIGFIVFVVVLLVIGVPWLTIIAINTLFGTKIIFGLKTWACTLYLTALLSGASNARVTK